MLRPGVAADRRISIRGAQMRHGRKRQPQRFKGYKRHVVRDLEGAGLIRAVGITPANAPEGAVTPLLEEDVAR